MSSLKFRKIYREITCAPKKNKCVLRNLNLLHKVRTFWEAQMIWKNLPHGFEVYLVKWGGFLLILGASQKVWTLSWLLELCLTHKGAVHFNFYFRKNVTLLCLLKVGLLLARCSIFVSGIDWVSQPLSDANNSSTP